jgi:ABC-type nitrate/sulfonate/bicarbonate transport system substrate-binding protein
MTDRTALPGLRRREWLLHAAGAGAAPLLVPATAFAQAAAPLPPGVKPLAPGEQHSMILGVGGPEPDFSYLAIWYAKYGGYFDALKKEGITVNVVSYPGGSEAILGLASGKSQMNFQSFENALRARAQGRDITTIYNSQTTTGCVSVVQKKLGDKVKTVKDTGGLRWGFSGFGASTHTVALRKVAKYGVPAASIQWIPVGGMAGMVPAMREGRIDVLTGTATAAYTLIHDGVANLLLDANDPKVVMDLYGYQYIGLGLLSSNAYTTANPYATYRIVDAVHRASMALRAMKASEVLAKLPPQYHSPLSEQLIQANVQALSATGLTNEEYAAKMTADLSELKITSANVTTQQILKGLVDNRFATFASQRA